jgi:hypothetical protein
MSKKKTRIAIFVGAAFFVFLSAVLIVRHERTAHFLRLQGAWEGALHFHWGQLMGVQRIVLKVSQENGRYRAAVDAVDLGVKNLPAAQFDFGSSVVNFRLTNGISFHGALDSETMEIKGRWKWPGGNYSQPLALTRTNAPDQVPEPLPEAEYTPRPGSDLQGLWAGTLIDEKPVRLQLKIAEVADGTFRAELHNLEQAPMTFKPVTSLNYEPPHVKLVLQGVAALFEGELNGSHTRMAGTWTQGRSFPMTFDRVNSQNEGKPN